MTPTLTPTPDSLTIAEVGWVTNLTDQPQTVNLTHGFVHPIVIAQPPSQAGSDPSIVRLIDIQSDQFTFYIDEAPNMNGSHSSGETVSYIVIEEGAWTLPDGTLIQAGNVDTSATVGTQIANVWEEVSFDFGFVGAPPVVVNQVQTHNDESWVKTRTEHVSGDGFEVALEPNESSSTGHGTETIGWLAIEPSGGTWSGKDYEASTTYPSVTNGWYTLYYGEAFSSSPRIVAGLASYNDGDNAELRVKDPHGNRIDVMVEEDTTFDGETAHTEESVAYLAIDGSGELSGSYYVPEPVSEGTPTPTPTLVTAGSGTYEDTSSVLRYTGDWEVQVNANLSSGRAMVADTLGESVAFRFNGSSLTYFRKTDFNRGIAEICVDGLEPGDCTDVDNYSASGAWIQPSTLHVPYGEHEVVLRYSGRKNPDSEGYIISLDKLTLSELGSLVNTDFISDAHTDGRPDKSSSGRHRTTG